MSSLTFHMALFYSLFNAATGSNLEAFSAGNKPTKILRPVEINHTLVISAARKIGIICELFVAEPLPVRPALRM